MPVPRRFSKTLISVLTGVLAFGGLLVVQTERATAAPAPVIQPTTDAMTADRLPTVQIDGVVWSQAVVGNTVYAGGKFNNARPAGAAAGTNLTPRGNLLAYDITTGNLITTFSPSLNGQVLSVAASPDGSRIYVVGDFTTANGQARRRVAAYSTSTGQLINSFNPVGVNSQARAVIATNSTVYVGGGFLGLGNGVLRNNLAAFSAADGSVLPWNPNADYTVWALAVSGDGSAVFAGGSFQNVGGQPAYGLAKIAGSGAGALDATWQPAVRNAGQDAGITSLKVQGSFVYGTTWHFGPGGNLEGTFKIPVANDNAVWVTDCHGDNYSTFLTGGIVYTAGHAHYCGNMGGGFPQYSQWKFQHAQAWSDTVTGDILNDVHGYPNWHGIKPGPAMVNWLPDLAIGSFTGQYQAGWSVTGNNDYLAYGGEFPRVNSVDQQGLVRFAKRSIAPKAEGPKFAVSPWAPTLVPTSATSVRVSWPAGYDRDNATLTYKAYRTGVSTPRYQADASSQWWNLPQLGFVDTGLTPGATYSYRVVVNDPGGNTVNGSTVSVTMPTSFPAATAYATKIKADGARIYWPLNETAGTTVTDRAAGAAASANVGVTDGRGDTGLTWGQPGAIAGDSAASLGDNDYSRVFAGNCAATAGCNWATETAPDTFSTQVWIKTTTTRGGRIFGFGDLQNGNSGHRDRHVYLDNSGHLIFGVKAQDNSLRTVSSARAYNDNQWHLVTATMGSQGMALYVDGVRVGRRADTTQGEAYLGYWRLGGDNLDGWPGQPDTRNFVGTMDEVAVYPTALSQAQIVAEYEASGRTSVVPPAPADPYGAAVYADDPYLFWRFAETSGTRAADAGKSLNDGTYRGGVTLGAAGVVSGNAAASFNGNDSFVSSDGQFSNPTVYSQEAWFKTTSTSGGKVIGFGDNQSGSSNNYDRHVYLQNDGKLVFGVWTGQANVITTPAAYNDGAWHHVVATQGASGMKLYLDGVLVGTNPQVNAQPYNGYWKVGGDQTWGSSSNYLNGTIDEAAVYSYELSAARVSAHFTAAVGTLNQNPTAAFSTTTTNLAVTADGSASSDPDGTIAAYAWKFGDGQTGTGKTTSHSYAAAGTYTVELTVTDNDGATATTTRSVTVSAANQSPVASFTTSVTNLRVSVDASASNDPDGSISSYAWNYGDGATGTGVTDSHTYAVPGTYTVTLTVKDNDQATAVTSKTVTVAAPPNADPVAAFTATPTNLTVAFNGSGSTDPDGTITGYSWNFGDGTSGTGATTSHTYPAAGSYPVVLTVTDNRGATDTESKSVTVTALAVLAKDTFDNRTVPSGWGSAETGGAWTTSTASTNFGVLNGTGTLKMVSSSGPSAYLNQVSATGVDLQTRFWFDKAGTGGGYYISLVGRRIGTSDYRIKLRATASGTTLYLVRTLNGTETNLATQTVSGLVVAPNDVLNLRLQAEGTAPTTLRAKIWQGTTEPSAWTLTSTDSTAALQNPGAVGIYTYLSGSVTNSPVTLNVDAFEARPLG